MEFEILSHRYAPDRHRLHFAARGQRDGVQFSVVTEVPCTSEPRTPDALHAAVLLKLNEIFMRPGPSGR